MGVLSNCQPRKEVLEGDLDDAIFAADFGHLIAGKAPKVYGDARTFFQNTHPAQQLCKVVQAVFGRLASTEQGGTTLRLSTGFGGGKTHTLMTLWHLAKNIGDSSLGTELLPAAGRPRQVTVVAVDAGKAGVPQFAAHGRHKVHSLWGEIFYQLGREPALEALGKADDPEASPSEEQVEAVFPKDGPVLILLDELVIYMARLSARGQGNLLGFLNALGAVVGRRRQTVLIVTDTAGQAVYAREAGQIGDTLAAATQLHQMLARKVADFDPIGNESARVIVRRLFQHVDPAAAQQASAVYHALYSRVAAEQPSLLPPRAAGRDYAQRIVECYPFHPRLLDTAQDRLAALQDFNKSRGTLRLFARILRDVWESEQDLELITAGDLDWSSPRIQADLLQRLNRDAFKPAVTADIERHAGELDGGVPRGPHRRVASALLLESIPLETGSGLDKAELTLAVLRPEDAGPEPAEALDRLVGVCWHTYPLAGGRGWQFRYQPNVIKLIEERKAQVPVEDARSRVLAEAQGYFAGPAFKVAAWPEAARQVPDVADLQLVLCDNESLAQAVCAYADDSDPRAPVPRRFQNAIVAVTATASAFANAVDRAQRLLAAEAIDRENRTGDQGRLVREQLQRLLPEYHKQFRVQTCRAFDRVVLAGNAYSLEEKFQVPEEQVLQKRAYGQTCLREFLTTKKLLYQPTDALDVDRFLKQVLPGATPLPERPEVRTARAIHERFLAAPGLRLVPDEAVVRQTILRGLGEGKLVVRLPDGRVYDAQGVVEGEEGQRRRAPGTLTTLPLDDRVQVAPADSAEAARWLQVDAPGDGRTGGGEGGPPPPPPPSQATAAHWNDVVKLAAERPLLELHLVASTPAAAKNLLRLAQPLGANSLSLSVTVGGTAKDGGHIQFAAAGLKPGHPIRPLTIADTVFNALGDSATYEAELFLDFDKAGRTGLAEQLQALVEEAPEGISPRATFGKPTGRDGA